MITSKQGEVLVRLSRPAPPALVKDGLVADQKLYAEVAPDRSRKIAAAAATPDRANPVR
jgi:hypothetical protein